MYSWFVVAFFKKATVKTDATGLSQRRLSKKNVAKYTYVSHFENLNASGAGIWVMNTILVLLVE